MIYFHTYKTDTQLTIDIVQDIRRLNDMSVKAKQAGMIVLGGGVCKHQIANAMLFVRLFRSLPSVNIADQQEERCGLCCVYKYRARGKIESSSWSRNWDPTDDQYDGSDSGARPDEAVSWGKIRAGAESVKVRISLCLSMHKLDANDYRCTRTRLSFSPWW